MCEFSERLIGWLDRELPENEAADVERHIQICTECRNQLAEYQDLSRTLDTYCDAVVASEARQRVPRWVPVAPIGVAAAVAAALFLFLPRTRIGPPVSEPLVKTAPSPIVAKATPPAVKAVHRHRGVGRAPNQEANLPPTEPAIQIAIPGESLFPPGAVPEGVVFTADLSIAADGSARQIRLRPGLIRVPRRVTEP
jgi:anti-sigma factor RsiW